MNKPQGQPLVREQLYEALKDYRDAAKVLVTFFERLSEFAQEFEKKKQAAAQQLQQFGETLAQLSHAARQLPQLSKDALATLANQGWYITSTMPMKSLLHLASEVLEGNTKNVDDIMIDLVDETITDDCQTICHRYSDRAKIISSAVDAYHAGKYELCVPIFIIQADGICAEKTGIGLYKKLRGPGARALKDYVDTNATETFHSILAEPLRIVPPLIFSDKQRQDTPVDLNRNAILHGENKSYDTKVNAAKTFTLLSSTSWFLNYI